MKARSSFILLASSVILVLFAVGIGILPEPGKNASTAYEPRNGAIQGQEAAYRKGALEYYQDLYQGATAERIKALREANKNFANPKAGSLDLDWSMEGPVNQGGRTRSILTLKGSPDEMWVGSVSGGIWRSYDNGENWEPIPAFNAHCIVSSMAQTQDGKIFVATGSSHESPNGTGASGFLGRGLFVTSNKGGSFSLVPGTQPDTNNFSDPWSTINEIVADPTGDTGVYIANRNGLRYYDVSTGTISNVANTTLVGEMQGLDISSDGSHILVSSASGRAYLSTDGGNSFTDLSGGIGSPLPTAGGRAEVAISPSNEDFMYVSMANSSQNLQGVYMTKNGGNDWGEISGGGSGTFLPFRNSISGQGNYDQAIAVDPGDPRHIVLGGVNFWEFKLDPTQFNPYAGQWSKVATTNQFPPIYVHADVHTFEWRSSDNLFVGTDGGVFVTNDGLESFLPSSKNFVATQYYSVEMSPEDQILGGTQDNGTQYLDRSNRWKYSTQVRGGDGFDCEISQLDHTVVFSTIYGNQGGQYVLRSENSGSGMSSFLNATSVAGLADDFYANIELFEDANDQESRDSVLFTNNGPSALYQGDSITFESQTLRKKVTTTLKVDTLQPDSSVMVQDPVQSLFAFTGHNNGKFKLFVTRDALRLTKSLLTARPVLELGAYNGGIAPGAMRPNAYEFSSDGNYLWIGMRNGAVYRISGLDSAYSSNGFANNVTATEVRSGGGLICTDISVDDNDPDHVVLSYGGYGGSKKVLQSYNATSPLVNWNNIWDPNNTNLSDGFGYMPVYSVLIETKDPNVILAGTEYGIFATDDAGNTWYHQNKDPLGNVPVFAIEQQDLNWNQGAKNPHHIYLGSHGRGFFKTDDLSPVKPRQETEGKEQADASLELFPNPAQDKAFLSFEDLPDGAIQVSIYDLNGRKVLDMGDHRVKGSERMRLDVQDLDEGVYIVRAQGSELDQTAKLVVRR